MPKETAQKQTTTQHQKNLEQISKLKAVIEKYSKSSKISKNALDEIERNLYFWAYTASESIKEEKTFGIKVLLIDRRDCIGDPNNLEKLIQNLKRAK